MSHLSKGNSNKEKKLKEEQENPLKTVDDAFIKAHEQELMTEVKQQEYFSFNNISASVFNVSLMNPLMTIFVGLLKTYGNDILRRAIISGVSTNIPAVDPFKDEVVVTICLSRPGIIIMKGGTGIDRLTENLKKLFGVPKLKINIREVHNSHNEIDY